MRTKHPIWLKLFTATRVVLCYCVLGMSGALRPIWPKAVYLRWSVLGRIGMKKVESGNLVQAKRIGNELIKLREDYWDYGNAIHKGNLILGRIALREGDVEAAGQYLVSAGKTPGAPQLASFGPNMTLAKELLEAGETEAVLEYFRLCGDFWQMDNGWLKWWARTVQSGKIPDFGAHLLY